MSKELLKAIQKEFGDLSAKLLGDVSQEVEFISTGSFALDDLLGFGLPCGRIVEIAGWESVGKSTLCASAIGTFQRQGGLAILLDTEHSYRPEWANWFGINPDTLILVQPETMEQTADMICFIAEKVRQDAPNVPCLIAWDSVAATPLKKEVEGEFSSKDMGLHARVLSAMFRRITDVIYKQRISLLLINQLREKLMGFGAGETKLGGHAIDFYAACLIRVYRTAQKPDRITCTAKCTKNKVATPFKSRAFEIVFEKGIDDTLAYLEYGIEAGIIEKKGGWYGSQGISFRQSDGIPELAMTKIKEHKLKVLKGEILPTGPRPISPPDAEAEAGEPSPPTP